MQFTTRVSRRFPYFAINNILLSVILTLLSFFAFAVPQSNPFGRLQLSFILLLTTVTFKSAASQNLPKIPYLTCLVRICS
jgi:magnesium-transporting ATPase (P-type)